VDPRIPRDEYEAICRMIEDPASPVGIDARKTHVIILHKLMALERRLDRLEALARVGPGTAPPTDE
jgi:hypothetical protein